MQTPLIEKIRNIIESFGHETFTIHQVLEELDKQKIIYKKNTAQLSINRDLKRQGFIIPVGKAGRLVEYQKKITGGHRPPAPRQAPPPDAPGFTLKEKVRWIVSNFKSDTFTVNDVFKALDDNGFDFSANSVKVIISQTFLKDGTTKKIKGSGFTAVYKKNKPLPRSSIEKNKNAHQQNKTAAAHQI